MTPATSPVMTAIILFFGGAFRPRLSFRGPSVPVPSPKRKSRFGNQGLAECGGGGYLFSAAIAQEAAQGTDREPSSARSAGDCTGSLESACARLCVRGRCEPRTARGPAAVSRCAGGGV